MSIKYNPRIRFKNSINIKAFTNDNNIGVLREETNENIVLKSFKKEKVKPKKEIILDELTIHNDIFINIKKNKDILEKYNFNLDDAVYPDFSNIIDYLEKHKINENLSIHFYGIGLIKDKPLTVNQTKILIGNDKNNYIIMDNFLKTENNFNILNNKIIDIPIIVNLSDIYIIKLNIDINSINEYIENLNSIQDIKNNFVKLLVIKLLEILNKIKKLILLLKNKLKNNIILLNL